MKKACLVTLTCVFLVLAVAIPSFAQGLTLFTDKESINVDMKFNGSEVSIFGEAPMGSDIYVKFSSPEKSIDLSKMGKKVLLWMPVENITIENVPGMFQVLTSHPIGELDQDLQATMGIDKQYEYVLSSAKVLSHGEDLAELTGADAQEFLAGLVTISSDRGLYNINEGGIKINGTTYEAVLPVPADIPRGSSTIEAYAVVDGQIVAHTDKKITARSTGTVQTIGHMASENSFVYGIFAVGIALFTGLFISTAFRKINQIVFKEEGDATAHH